MQAQILKGERGWLWLAAGLRLYRKNPIMLSLIMMNYFLTIIFLMSIPSILGSILLSLALVILNVGIMNACKALDDAAPFNLLTLYSALANPGSAMLRNLLMLGGLYLLYSMLAMGLTALIDGGALYGVFSRPQATGSTALQIPLASLAMLLALMLPAIMAWWFAPVLCAWHNLGVAKALFFSLYALWRNWRSFLAYGVTIMFWGILIPSVVSTLLMLIVPGAANYVSIMMVFILLLYFAPVMFASIYVGYCEIFTPSVEALEDGETEPAPPAGANALAAPTSPDKPAADAATSKDD